MGLYFNAGDDFSVVYISLFRRKKIALGVAYALWEGIGILFIPCLAFCYSTKVYR